MQRLSARCGLLLVVAISGVARAHPVVAAFERFYAQGAADTATEGGLLLLSELNCVACHLPPSAWSERLPGRGRISLAGVGARLAPDALAAFVQDPARLKPGTTMPQIVARGETQVSSLVAYLQALTASTPVANLPAGNKERGKRLYESIGCSACHAPADAPANTASVPIGLAAHYDRRALAAFLRDPLHTRPAGRMPAAELLDREAADLAEFLGAKNLPTPLTIASAERTVGRAQFVARNCAACHETGELIERRLAKPLVQLRVGEGCLLASPASGLPRFNLSPAQTRAVAAALKSVQSTPVPPTPSAPDRVRARFEQLNCYACHEWRGRGGLDASRLRRAIAADSTTEPLGELGRLPPSLDSAGRKLTPFWLEKLLWGSGGGVRPYLGIRMPRFGRESSVDLPAILAETCRPDQPLEIDTSGGKGHQRSATGRALIGTGTGGLGCVNCHGLKNQESRGIHAINLTHTAVRIQPEYFKALLLDPQHIQPGTIMPPLFMGRAAADKEIESIWTYLKELDQGPMLPEGLAVASAFELKPADEKHPIIFRTFLVGAGTQAIAVGTPAGLHAAFDAFEVRWALVWRGRFIDAQQNWEERAMKPVKALGEKVVTLPAQMPFANLETSASPWPASFGARAGYTFKGYRVADDGVPTFRYTIGALSVEDTLRPAADGSALQRRTVVRGAGAGWYFRGFAPGAEPQRVEWKNGTATFEETIAP